MIYLTILQGGGGGSSIFFIGIMFVVMFVFMIYPQWQRQKKEKKFQEELKKGSQIVTNTGIHGRVAEIADSTVVIETMAGKLKIERSSISPELTKQRYSNNN